MNIMHQNDGTGLCLIHGGVDDLVHTGLAPVEGIHVPENRGHAVGAVHFLD